MKKIITIAWKRRLSAILVSIMMISQICSGIAFAAEGVPMTLENRVTGVAPEITTSGAIEIVSDTTTSSTIKVIGDIEELKKLQTSQEGEVYRLENDIDLSGESWTAINFNGTLDGAGYTITLDGEPLFNEIGEHAVVKNLSLGGSIARSEEKEVGPLAITSKGTIYNCYSSADIRGVSFTMYAGGLVGEVAGGKINNSFVTGTIGLFDGGIAGKYTTGTISNTYWINGFDLTGDAQYWGENCSKKTAEEAKKQAFCDLLNKDLHENDMKWGFDLGKSEYPLLGATGSAPVVKTKLISKLDEAEQYKNDDHTYTEKTWNVLQLAIEEGQLVKNDPVALQYQVDECVATLDRAIKGLLKVVIDPQTPDNPDDIIPVTTKEQLETMEDGKYYQLQNDITLDRGWFHFGELNAVLDGNGYKIIMSDSPSSLFNTIGEQGVVKNLGIVGTLSYGGQISAIASVNKGRIINCYSIADIKSQGTSPVGGLVGRLEGGAIHNSYAAGALVGNVSSKKGGLIGRFNSGSITNSYWLDSFTADDAIGVRDEEAPEPDLETVSAIENMKTEEFINLLNAHKGNSMEWGYDKALDAIIIGGKDPLPETDGEESPYTITYTSIHGTEPIREVDGKMQLFTTEQGTFTLEGYDEKVYWVTSAVPEGSKKILWIMSDGKIYSIDNAGQTKLSAYQDINGQQGELLTEALVTTKTPEVLELQVWMNGVDVTNGKVTIRGREQGILQAKAKLEGTDQFIDVGSNLVAFKAKNGDDKIDLWKNYFTFNRPDTEIITVESLRGGVSASVEVTSEYVPITSITPGIGGSFALHGRNPNSESGDDFLVIRIGMDVEPSNASYGSRWEIESSNPEVADYVASMAAGVVPYKAGTTTFTAIANDNGTIKTGTSEVSFYYEEPLQNVTAKEVNITIPTGSEQLLNLIFTSEKGNASKNEKGSVSEPGLEWTFEGDGAVNIYRKNLINWVQEESSRWAIASQDYTIEGLKEGKVIATGTPIDQTKGAKPITLHITVTEGDIIGEDVSELTLKGIDIAKKYLASSQGNANYEYNDEWYVFSLARSGQRIDEEKLAHYYDSVIKTYNGPLSSTEKKPTTIARVALTLDAINKNATNAEGIDFIEMLYNHKQLNGTSNDVIFALIALDACQYEIPANASWSRERMIDAILDYQTPAGGFGLTDNQSASVDMTAMALQALSNYTDDTKVQVAVNKALGYLRTKMDKGTAGFGGSVESAAQVLTALTALGIDPVDEANGFTAYNKNIITNLMMFYDEEGKGFSHNISGEAEPMSTVQVLYSLEAYRRFINDENKLYDLTDVSVSNILKSEIAKAEKIQGDDYTAESFEKLQKVIQESKDLLNKGQTTEEEIQEQIGKLIEAIENLEFNILEKKQLIDKLSEINQLVKNDYTKESWEVLQKAVKEAEGLLNDPSAKREDFKNHLKVLTDAVNNLRQVEKPEVSKGTVTLSIDAQTIGEGYFMQNKEIEIGQGDTVADVLKKAVGESNLKITGSGKSIYVASMRFNDEWLGEFDHGPNSGWLYSVNGDFPGYSSGIYALSDGDEIEWRYTKDLGNDIGNDFVDTPIDKPDVSVEVDASKDKDGIVKGEVLGDQLESLIKEIDKLKDSENVSLQINISTPEDSKGVSLTLPKSIVNALAQTKDMALVISSDYATLKLDAKAVNHMAAQSKNEGIVIETMQVPKEKQSLETRIASDGRNVYSVNIMSGKERIMNFGGKVTVSIPYLLQSDETASNMVFYYQNEEGQIILAEQIQYNEADEMIEFVTQNPKVYIVSYVKTLFDDVEGESGPYIYYLANKNLINGKGNNLFEPDSNITRAELTTILARISKEDLNAYNGTSFDDVKEGAWYEKSIAWASKQGIVMGYNNKFNPNEYITSQDMLAMLLRYVDNITVKGLLNNQKLVTSEDNQIVDYVKEIVYKVQQAGMINDKEDKKFLPTSNVTREEIAKILALMLEVM